MVLASFNVLFLSEFGSRPIRASMRGSTIRRGDLAAAAKSGHVRKIPHSLFHDDRVRTPDSSHAHRRS